MTRKQKEYKKALIRSIHCSPLYKKIYANDRELYEEMLFNNFGVRSSKDLSIDELKNLNNFMHKKELRLAPKKVYASKQQIAFIKALWLERSKFKFGYSLLNFAKKALKKEIKDLTKITKKEAKQLIASIKSLKPLEVVNNIEGRREKVEGRREYC